jgi:hypothetical protein
MFKAALHSNGSYFIVVCVFVTSGMCLLSHCLVMNVYWLHYSLRQASCRIILPRCQYRGYMESMKGEWLSVNWEDLEGSGRVLIQVICRHLPEGPRKTQRNLNQDSLCPGRDPNRSPPEWSDEPRPQYELELYGEQGEVGALTSPQVPITLERPVTRALPHLFKYRCTWGWLYYRVVIRF